MPAREDFRRGQSAWKGDSETGLEAALAQQQHHFLKYVSSVAGRRTAVDLPCPFREPSAIGGSRALEMGVFRVSKGVSVKQCRFQRFILIAYCMIYYKYIYFLNVGFIFFSVALNSQQN